MFSLFPSSRPIIALSAFVAASLFAADTVVIGQGDTLSELALANDVAMADLMEWNDIDDPDLIVAGRTLIVSPPDAAGVAEQYVVQRGETLYRIARRFNTSTAHLAEANSIDDPDRIYIGQTLQLGGGADRSGPATSTGPTTTGTATHTVVPGDTLSEIAEAHGVRTSALATANAISDRHLIRIGQTLTIPVGTTTPTPAPTEAPAPDAPATVAPPATAPPVTPPATAAPTPGSPASAPLVPLFAKWSVAYGVPQDLLEAIAWKESDWRPDAVGPGGQLGIAQMSPATVAFVEERLLGLDLDPLAHSDGTQLAARYLRYVLDRTDSEREAVAAWNQGLTDVQTNGISEAGSAYADAVFSIRESRR